MVRDQITGLVLAGGQGSRMGGVDKGLQNYRGRPLVRWAIDRLVPQVGALRISANRNLEIYRSFGFEVEADEPPGFHGPLAGLLAGMANCRTPCIAIVPCDTPDFPLDLVAQLSLAMDGGNADIAMAAIGTADGTRLQPVFALLKTSLQPSLRDFVLSGGSKVREWMFRHECKQFEFPDPLAFSNINTIDQLTSSTRSD